MAGKFEFHEERFFLFCFSCIKEGLYALKTGKRENDDVFCFVFNVHMITLQLLVNH